MSTRIWITGLIVIFSIITGQNLCGQEAEKQVPPQTDLGLKELGLPLTEKNERKYREDLRKKLGMAAYAIKIKPRIQATLKRNNRIVLDGLYSWAEYIYLSRQFPNLILLAVYAQPKIRYQRLSSRKTRTLTDQEARERDLAEIVNSDKGGPIAIADYLVQNNSSFKLLYQRLDRFLENLK